MHAPITELVDFDRKFASDNPHFISHTHPPPPPADKPDKEGSCLSPGSNTTGLDVGNHSHGPTLPRSCLQTTRQVAAIVGKGIVETHYCTLDGAKGCHQRRCPFHRAMNQIYHHHLMQSLGSYFRCDSQQPRWTHMASSAPYDPIARFGSDWRRASDGSEVRVVVSQGRYCFETKGTRRIIPIPNTIDPPSQSRAIPRTARRQSEQKPEPPDRDQGHGSYNKQAIYTQRSSTPEQTSSQYDRQVTYSYSPQDEHYEIAAPRGPPRASRQYHDDRRRDDRQGSNPSGNQTQIVTDRSRNMSYDEHRGTNRTALPTQSANTRARSGFNVEDLELDRTVSDFVEIPLARFPECHDYIKRHKAVFDTSLKDLLDAASKAAKIGEIILAKQCIQRLVLLKTCRDFNSDGRAQYFQELATPHSEDSQAFYAECDRYEERIRPRSEKSSNAFGDATGTSRDQGIQHSPAYPSTMPTGSAGYRVTNTQGQPAVGNSYPTNSVPSSGPGMTQTRRPSVAFPSNPRSTAFKPLPYAHESQDRDPQTDRAPLGRSRDSYYDPEIRRRFPTANQGLNADFRPDNTVELDRRYRKQNANVFFVPGRVFSIVLHHSLGLQQGKSKSNKTKPDVIDGYKGEKIVGGTRRMIVWRQRQGYSLCVPISSYGNNGVGEKKVGEIEKQAHAIVYPNGSAVPRPLPKESHFEKKPIAVDMFEDQTLTASSRIHFGKCQTVEHNVKVMNIGKVARDSMADFETYCKQELLR